MGVSSLNPVSISFYRDMTAVALTLQTFHEVKNLVPSSYYAISVRAFTSVGAGQFSEMVIDGTDEDSEFFLLTFYCMCVLPLLQCSVLMQRRHNSVSRLLNCAQSSHQSSHLNINVRLFTELNQPFKRCKYVEVC